MLPVCQTSCYANIFIIGSFWLASRVVQVIRCIDTLNIFTPTRLIYWHKHVLSFLFSSWLMTSLLIYILILTEVPRVYSDEGSDQELDVYWSLINDLWPLHCLYLSSCSVMSSQSADCPINNFFYRQSANMLMRQEAANQQGGLYL